MSGCRRRSSTSGRFLYLLTRMDGTESAEAGEGRRQAKSSAGTTCSVSRPAPKRCRSAFRASSPVCRLARKLRYSSATGREKRPAPGRPGPRSRCSGRFEPDQTEQGWGGGQGDGPFVPHLVCAQIEVDEAGQLS